MSLHKQVFELTRRIEGNDARRLELERVLTECKKSASISHRQRRIRQLQKRIRQPAESFNLWPLGLILISAVLAGSVAFVISFGVAGAWGLALIVFVLFAVVAAAMTAWVLFVPSMEKLDAIISQSDAQLHIARETENKLQVELSDARFLIREDTQSLDAIQRSLQFQRETLLQENWKAMRGPEWEDFLARAFRLLGATVQPTGASGDQGVDLIATIGPRCYAIQAKGYEGSVGNGAVQEAVAGMAHYRCNACAVITNSRFTASATALAESNRCRLIGEDDIPALVLGKLALRA